MKIKGIFITSGLLFMFAANTLLLAQNIAVRQITDTPGDCKNPQFLKEGFSVFGQTNMLLYEVHQDNSSGISYKTYDAQQDAFSSPRIIVNDGAININPSAQGYYKNGVERFVVYWQTNKNGNWDIAYRILENGTWGQVQMLAATGADETYPCIVNTESRLSEFNVTYKRGNEIRLVREINNVVSDIPVFTGTTTTDYSEVSAYTSYDGFSLVFAKQTALNREVTWVYKEVSESAGPGQIIQTSFQINNLSFRSRMVPYLANGGVIMDATEQGRKKIYALDRYQLANSNAIVRVDIDSTMDVYGLNFYGLPFVMEKRNFSLLPYMWGPISVFCIKNDELFLATKFTNWFNYSLVDTLIPVSYKSSHSAVGPVGIFHSGYSYITSFVVWEDSVDGRVQLFGLPRYDILGDIAPQNRLPDFRMLNNYPNPFNPSTKIEFELPQAAHVRLEVFDMLGRRVAVLLDENRSVGMHAVGFTPGNIAAGIYFAKLSAGSFAKTIKMLYLK